MTSLTYMLDVKTSDVSRWMLEEFPHHKPLLKEIRREAGTLRLPAPDGVALGALGGAIDWWLRFIIDPNVPRLDVARSGLDRLEGHPAYDAGAPMFSTLTAMEIGGHRVEFEEPIDPMARLLEHDDEFQARTCYALALMTEFFRAPITVSRLLNVPEDSSPQALLDLATVDEVADLIRMKESAQQALIPRLPEGAVVTGPTFDGSKDLSADADMIVGDTLVEMKATQGAQALVDGTKPVRVERTDIYQMLGYLLMDYSDRYRIRNIGFYAIRFEYYKTLSVDEFLSRLAGRSVDLSEARSRFRMLLRGDPNAFSQGTLF